MLKKFSTFFEEFTELWKFLCGNINGNINAKINETILKLTVHILLLSKIVGIQIKIGM
jgi:hypothetical protein